MERKRRRLGLSDDEENEEEDWDRRISPRKTKRVKYIEENDDDDEEEEEEGEDDEGDWDDNEQPGPSTNNTPNNRPQENSLLPVTCGNKTGILDVKKMHWGEACIKYEDRWVLPTAFEEFGGKGFCKKWKASIFHDKKPLQFWFEQGSLTTKGFKSRRSETAKVGGSRRARREPTRTRGEHANSTQKGPEFKSLPGGDSANHSTSVPPAKHLKKTMSSNHTSESASEESAMQSAEETEESVKDENWLPGSEELALQTEVEEERVGEYGGEVVDSGVDQSEEEREMEDEEMAAVADNDKDNSVFEERAKLRIPPALQKKVKVVIKRLPETKDYCQSKSKEQPVDDSCGDPLKEDSKNTEESERAGSSADQPSIILATHLDPSPMSDTPIVGGAGEESGEEFTQSNERKEDAQREIKTETGHLSTPLSAPVTSHPDAKPELLNKSEDFESSSIRTVILSASEVLLLPVTDTDIQEETKETGHSGCRYESTDATTSGAAESQVAKRETSVPKAAGMVVGPPSGPCTGSDLDAMDLEQLRREKIKMQLKVLTLQEEYYTQKIKKHKQCQCFRGASL